MPEVSPKYLFLNRDGLGCLGSLLSLKSGARSDHYLLLNLNQATYL